MNNLKGMYIHIPFCLKKCDYCDFYSLKYSPEIADLYTKAVIQRLNCINDAVDTVYFGGGTPSVMGYERIVKILENINYTNDAEITVECNPNTATKEFFDNISKNGVNRVSIGLQSANNDELSFLTRTHSCNDVMTAVTNAKLAGIDNISLDIMIGLKNQTISSLKNTIDFCISLDVKHISAYMLKIEPNTPFDRLDKSILPTDDQTADLYEFATDYLEKNGYIQYEISNYSKVGFESKHNLKYWNCDEYYGIGPAAHSFIDKKRYYYEKDINSFINGAEPIYDCDFEGFFEYAMLRLRLKEGLIFKELENKGLFLPNGFLDKCSQLAKHGYMIIDDTHVAITKKGFSVQNAILNKILN